MLSVLAQWFKSKSPKVQDATLGTLIYYKDKVDEYWEVERRLIKSQDSLDIDFSTVAGDKAGPNSQALEDFKYLLSKPTILWELLDQKLHGQKVVAQLEDDIHDISLDAAPQHLYIRSLAMDSINKFEVGFHTKADDIFYELFVRNGKVMKVERDEGCCS